VQRYAVGERAGYPPFPEHFFPLREKAILDEYRLHLQHALQEGLEQPEFPEKLIAGSLDNTWHDTAEGIVANWIGLVYQITHQERKRPFMEGIDPTNPLGLKL
jgi:homoserine O-succinyltransferase